MHTHFFSRAEFRNRLHRAGLILYGLQQAANNLRGKEDRASFAVSPDTENRCLSYDSFEADFELNSADGASETADPLTATAQDGENPTPPSAEDDHGEASAGGKIAAEPAAATPCSIIIGKIHAVAQEDDEEDEPAPAKPPRGMRPPIAERQSGEAALAISEECGRDHEGKVVPCAKCGGEAVEAAGPVLGRRQSAARLVALKLQGSILCWDFFCPSL